MAGFYQVLTVTFFFFSLADVVVREKEGGIQRGRETRERKENSFSAKKVKTGCCRAVI